MDQTQRRRQQKLRIEAGAEVLRALEDPSVTEVLLNPDGRLWVDSMGEGMAEIGQMLPLNAEALIGTVADALGVVATSETPSAESSRPPRPTLVVMAAKEGKCPSVMAQPISPRDEAVHAR